MNLLSDYDTIKTDSIVDLELKRNMKLKEIYYRIKYGLGRQSGAVGIITSGRKKDDFCQRLEKLEPFILPCYKENKEVLCYLESRYNVKKS